MSESEAKTDVRTAQIPWPEPQPFPKEDLPPVKREDQKEQPLQFDPVVGLHDWFAQSITARKYSRKITFYINGRKQVVRDPHPATKLSGYIRRQGFTGLQVGCGSGHCGACSVVISKVDPGTGKAVHLTTNGCMRMLASMDGYEVTTVEGVGSKSKGYHPFQLKVAEENGSQCGFCTPGFVTQMYGLLLNDPKPHPDTVENAFQGNLCRCTGYRSILKAAQSFARGPDESASDEAAPDIISPPLKSRKAKPFYSKNGYYRPLELADVHELLEHYKDVSTKLVVGNTGSGVVGQYPPSHPSDSPDVHIDISRIPDLLQTEMTDDGLVVGASVTISNLIYALESEQQKDPSNTTTFSALAKHLRQVATPAVRNTGCWAGNLMVVKRHPDFPSDVLTILSGVGAQLTIADSNGSKTISMNEFMSQEFSSTSIIRSVCIPKTGENVKFGVHIATARKHNAHAIVNGAFKIELDDEKRVKDASIVYGGLQPGVLNAGKAEEFLSGKPLISHTLKGVLHQISEETKEAHALHEDQVLITSNEYRRSVALTLFYKFFLSLQEVVDPRLESAFVDFERDRSTGTQTFKGDESLSPVSDPVTKIEGVEQAAGELQYVGDLKVRPDELYGAPVLSTEANAYIDSIDASEALKVDGVVDFISAKDVQNLGGFNETGLFPGDYPIFATKQVMFVGQFIGVVVAKSANTARAAVKKVKVHYRAAEEPPILTIQDAIARESYHDQNDPRYTFVFRHPEVTSRGNVEKGFAEADHIVSGEVGTGSQDHWYMETQSTAVTPEDNKITVHTSSQSPSYLRNYVARAVNLDSHRVNVVAQRAGGGFGGKITGAVPNACATAVAAVTLQKPVRMKLSRKEDMINTAKRDPFLCRYKVGFNDDGAIKAIEMEYYNDGGCSFDLSVGMQFLAHRDGDNVYHFDNFRATGKVCKTNLPSNTAMRAPAHTSSVFFTEHVMNIVGLKTGIDPAVIKERHFYKDGGITPAPLNTPIKNPTVQQCWDLVKKMSNYDELVQEVESFNTQHRWKKRGVSINPLKYALGYGLRKVASIVSIGEGDGTVSVSHGCCELGQGLNTKVVQAVAYRLKIPIEKVVISSTATMKVPTMGSTGGSTTSEAAVKASIDACDTILYRMAPVREKNPDDPWEVLVKKSGGAGVLLNATGWFAPGGGAYHQWSAAVNVVELDVLTGAVNIISTDIAYDCGVSLNPKIDIGQIEGGFVQGLGMFGLEEIVINRKGRMINNRPWDYHLPDSNSIPSKFNVSFLEDTPFADGVFGSKASGEPAVILACGVLFATQNAIRAARNEVNEDKDVIDLSSPLTVEHGHLACNVTADQLTLD